MSANGPGPSTSSLKGKRKKKLPANPNPLFTQWLQEWKDEAKEKGWKSAHTYGNALKTLKLFPLPLESGKDCKLLRNFGDKICKMLDEKLAQYKLDGGVVPVPKESQGNHASSSSAGVGIVQVPVSSSIPPVRNLQSTAASHSAPSPPKRKGPTSVSSQGSSSSRTGAHSVSDDSGSDIEGRPPPQKKTRVPSGNAREYVPAYRSGPYALILSLYRTMQTPGYRGYVLKTELIDAAQPLADKSFTIPDPGSRYTAWSSMGTVIRKGLIIKYSNPAKFFLTEKGQALAERLEEAENGNNVPAVTPPPVNSQGRSSSLSENVPALSFPSKSAATTSCSVSPGCQVFDTGDADLDAALNASLIENSQSHHNMSHKDDSDFGEAEINAALNKSLEVSSHAGKEPIGLLNDDMEDADLGAALKASLETSSSQDASGRTSAADARIRSSCHERQHLNNDFSIELEDTDLEAAIKASLESSSSQEASSPSKTQNIPVGIKKHSTTTSSEASTGLRPLPNLSPPAGHRSDSDDEDEEMKRAIAESLRSYSEELSTSQCSQSDPVEDDKCKAINLGSVITSKQPEQSKPKDLNVSADCSVLVVSDEDDDVCVNIDSSLKKETMAGSPSKFSRGIHEVSPSPSPPPCPLPNLSSSPVIIATKTTKPKMPACPLSSSPKMFTTVAQEHDSKFAGCSKVSTNKQPVLLLSLGVGSECGGGDVVPITDVDAVDNNNETKKDASKLVSVSAIDSDDELPDLDVPLFQRLLNKGNIQSDLLKDSAASKKNVTNAVKPSNCDVESLHSKNTQAVVIEEVSGSFDKKIICRPPEPGSYVHTEPTLPPLPSCTTQMRNVCKEKKEGSHNVNTGPANYIVPPRNVPSNLTSTHLGALSSDPSSSLSAPERPIIPTCTPDFTLQPGTFDIILCLDNREFYGSKSSCKTLLPDLMKCGVQCDLRLLHVGDLLWIARERLGPQIDRVQGRELVLNYIVERKRMDDLVSSLTDGRMKEQKFRLKHCGLSETIILIEEYGSVQNFSMSEGTIKQSIVNSQMIDGFKVKRCGNAQDAVSYLAIMTRFLQQSLCNKTLHAVSVDQMKLFKGRQNLHDSEQYLAPFTAFNEAAVKHKDLKVTELFAKQLIQVPGVSAERAKAITSIYPTLSLLMDAYKKCNSAKDSEKLLATIKYGKNERNLGIAVSRMLHMLYTQQESLS